MKAFITGVTGQDGYYLSKLLLEKGYEVHGIVRRSSSFNTERIDPLIAVYGQDDMFQLYYSDLLDGSSLYSLINKIKPDEIYNMAAQSHVAVSFKNPLYSTNTSTIGPLTLLEAVKNSEKDIKFYQASSSEMFGGYNEVLLNEDSIFDPKSPYAAGKVFAHNLTKLYRESYGIFAVNGILFNHESPLRGETFVTRKVTRAVGRIYYNLQEKLTLGNLKAKRDWGYSADYMEGVWRMLQYKSPEDFVLSTGESHSVEEFVSEAFAVVGLNWEDYVTTDKKYYRPNEVNYLLGDSSKAKKLLGWSPKVDFKNLIKMMIESDLALAEKEKVLIENNLLKPTWEHPTKL